MYDMRWKNGGGYSSATERDHRFHAVHTAHHIQTREQCTGLFQLGGVGRMHERVRLG